MEGNCGWGLGVGGSAAFQDLSKTALSWKFTSLYLTAYNSFTARSGGLCGDQVQAGSFSQMEKQRHRQGKSPSMAFSESSPIIPSCTVKGSSACN